MKEIIERIKTIRSDIGIAWRGRAGYTGLVEDIDFLSQTIKILETIEESKGELPEKIKVPISNKLIACKNHACGFNQAHDIFSSIITKLKLKINWLEDKLGDVLAIHKQKIKEEL